ncbi:MAG: ROK family protein, partial [Candidatus Omnitrophica bacterium]|nr:ROK family protein [Candidatus Omnitrophota bacterium]
MVKVNSKEMERRQSLRLEKTLPVKFDLPHIPSASGTYEALSRNIALGGVFVETDLVHDENFSLDKDALINLEIELLGQMQKIRPKAKIVWISRKSRSPQKKRSGFGLKFIQITPSEKRAISLFISQEMLTPSGVEEKQLPVITREQRFTDRERRNLEILNTIRSNRLISRAEISKTTGINIVTVSNYVDTYLKKGLVFERGLDISTGGRRPELLEINPQYGYVIGADLGPLNAQTATMQALVCDFTGKMLSRAGAERKDDNIENYLGIFKKLISEVIKRAQVQREKTRGIGIGISGIMDRFNGTVCNPLSGSTFANYQTIKKDLENEFSLPVFVENSAACALFAEKWNGINLEVKAADNIIYIFSDSQCAIMLKGELYTGSNKSAGQLSLSAAGNNWPENQPALPEEEDLEAHSARLGEKIAYLVNLFNPQVIIIGDCFSYLGDVFLDQVRRTVNHLAFRENASIVRLTAATLEG